MSVGGPTLRRWFARFACWTAEAAGSPTAFSLALAVILLWTISGPFFGFSDTWQLVVNTGTTVVTFLMVFLLQHTQAADTKAIQLKLDEIVRAEPGADNRVAGIEREEARP